MSNVLYLWSYIENNNGLRMEPCGKPLHTIHGLEIVLQSLVACIWLLRYDLNQLIENNLKRRYCSFRSRIKWSTVSKTLVRSRKRTQQPPPLLASTMISSYLMFYFNVLYNNIKLHTPYTPISILPRVIKLFTARITWTHDHSMGFWNYLANIDEIPMDHFLNNRSLPVISGCSTGYIMFGLQWHVDFWPHPILYIT